jgi:hypothetical protein
MDSLSVLPIDSFDYVQNQSLDNSCQESNLVFPKDAFVNPPSQVSLVGRVSLQQNGAVLGLLPFGAKNNVPPIEIQLQEFFKSTELTKKLFIIDGQKVGIIFNPKREILKFGFLSVGSAVIIASNATISENMKDRINASTPEQYQKGRSIFTGTLNGQSPLKIFGFE